MPRGAPRRGPYPRVPLPIVSSATEWVAAGLPPHVRTAFGVRDALARPAVLGGIQGWCCGEVFIRPVADHAMAAWSARVLGTLRVDGVRVARPLRASDGRWVVAGYSACEYITGTPRPHYEELVAASLRLHAATASVRRPRLLDQRDGLAARADAAAWGERAVALEPTRGGRLFDELVRYRRQVRLPAQVVHGDLFGTMLFDDAHDVPPAIVDLVPYWRPVEWAAAVIVVDALAWGGGQPELVVSWSHLEGWPQVLLRALLFRVALHAQHPGSSGETLRGLAAAADLILPQLRR